MNKNGLTSTTLKQILCDTTKIIVNSQKKDKVKEFEKAKKQISDEIVNEINQISLDSVHREEKISEIKKIVNDLMREYLSKNQKKNKNND